MSNIKVIMDRDDMVSLANSIRNKIASVNEMTIGGMINAVDGMDTELKLQEKTITSSVTTQIITPDDEYNGLNKVTVNPIPIIDQAVPSITINNNGLITASTNQKEGYVANGTKNATKQLPICEGRTIIPGLKSQTIIAEGQYAIGDIDVEGDDNLIPENIKAGVTIFSVTGTHSGAEDLEAELTAQEAKIAELSALLDTKASGSSGGSIETCTVNLTFDSALYDIYFFSYTCVDDNGKLYTVLHNAPNDYIGTTQTITVPCGSLIFVNCMASFPDVKNVAGGLEVLLSEYGTLFIQAPLTADSIGFITFYDADAW